MTLRALKEEHTAVKMLYLSAYCIVVAGAALVVDPDLRTWPSAEQAALLLCLGAT